MKELLEKEIKYTMNAKGKENLKKVLEYLENLEEIIYKFRNMQVLNDEQLKIYKEIGDRNE